MDHDLQRQQSPGLVQEYVSWILDFATCTCIGWETPTSNSKLPLVKSAKMTMKFASRKINVLIIKEGLEPEAAHSVNLKVGQTMEICKAKKIEANKKHCGGGTCLDHQGGSGA
jgi:hypothetical protein